MGTNQELHRIKETLRRELPRLGEAFSVRELGVFGSWVTGEQNESSDLDLLIEFDSAPSLFRFVELEEELSRLTGKPVDLVMKTALKPRIGRRILREVQSI